jgi:hypothetical protein
MKYSIKLHTKPVGKTRFPKRPGCSSIIRDISPPKLALFNRANPTLGEMTFVRKLFEGNDALTDPSAL